MAEEALYKYRLFTGTGNVFNVFCKIDTKEKLWKALTSTKKDEPIEEEFYHISKIEDERVGLIIRPSAIVAIDAPFGTEPVIPVREEDKQKITSRAIPNRVVIDSRPNPEKSRSKNLLSKRKVKR